jgi:hypothetical protein
VAIAHIDLRATDDDDSKRRKRGRAVKALLVIAGVVLLGIANGEPDPPSLHVAGRGADFGELAVGTSAAQPVVLRNAAQEPFVVAGIMALGPSMRDFSVDAASCGRIAPGGECSAMVSFAPRDAGPREAKFRVVGEESATSEEIVIRGVGTVPQSMVTPPVVTPPVVTPPVVTPPVITPQVVKPPVVTPPVVKPPVQRPPVVKPPPVTETVAPVVPEKPPVTETTATEAPPAVTETMPPPATTTEAPPKKGDRGKTIGKAVAVGAVILGAFLANRNHDRKPSADRRIAVDPNPLGFDGRSAARGGGVTVTSVGRDPVTIRQVSSSHGLKLQSGCDGLTLKTGEQCRIWVTGQLAQGENGRLVISSDGGNVTVNVNFFDKPTAVIR